MTVRIALVGCGSMGHNHARVIAGHPGSALAMVIDPDQDAGERAAAAHGARWTDDVDAVGDADAAVIAAPTEHHRDLALRIIDAGIPLLVEKPLCPSLEQSQGLVTAAESADVVLMCGLLERFNPAVMTAMTMVDEPLYVRAERHSPYAPRIRTGVGWDLLVHDVDLVVRLFGGAGPAGWHVEVGEFHPQSVPGAEDVVEALLKFHGGGIASISASRIGQRKVRTMVVQELDRMLEIDLLRRTLTCYRHTTVEGDLGHAGFRQMTEMEVPEIVGAEPLVSQLSHFLRLVRGEADPAEERASILPAHQVVEEVLHLTGSTGR